MVGKGGVLDEEGKTDQGVLSAQDGTSVIGWLVCVPVVWDACCVSWLCGCGTGGCVAGTYVVIISTWLM